MPIIETGIEQEMPWSIEVKRSNRDGRYHALVTLGTNKRITDRTYTYEDEAEAAAVLMLANMVDDLMEVE